MISLSGIRAGEQSTRCQITGPGPFEHLTVEQQILLIHLTGRLITTVDEADCKVTICSVAGYLVKIYCRLINGHWQPYLVAYASDGTGTDNVSLANQRP